MTDRPVVIVCADDFGMSSGVSLVIGELLAGGALNATTCLTDPPAWKAHAGRLRDIADASTGVSVGLHLDAPSLRASAALIAFRAQWAAFEAAFGRAPDFVDGHRHCHLFPGPRRALFRLLAETDARPWLRQCRTSSARPGLKRLLLDPLSAAFRREARKRGYVVSPGFGGLRRFDPNEDIARIWREDLEGMTAGGLLMTHPGPIDSDDPICDCRAQEANLLAGAAIEAALAGCGLVLASGRAPWRLAAD